MSEMQKGVQGQGRLSKDDETLLQESSQVKNW
jgi:hypothetical protein